MQTHFSPEQLADPRISAINDILRKCVHCGFCNATCPTFRLTGDELDGPRGRIYLLKDLLENANTPGAEVISHIDRCLSCLSCMSTCPSGVDYMHLIDHGRSRIESSRQRPLGDLWLRRLLAALLTRPRLLSASLNLWPLFALAGLLPGRLRAPASFAVRMARTRSQATAAISVPARRPLRGRVALLTGCVQPVLGEEINVATTALLTRLGYAVSRLQGCCGAVEHHLGLEPAARSRINTNLRIWVGQITDCDAIIVNASGCGTMIKDYGNLLRDDEQHRDLAAQVAGKTRDITEFIAEHGLISGTGSPLRGLKVIYQSPCSLQHGQGVRAQPPELLRRCGYTLQPLPDAQLCCGGAGTYSLLQPHFARAIGRQKAAALNKAGADVIASGNLGCMLQLRPHMQTPIVHTAGLLNWALGGEKPY